MSWAGRRLSHVLRHPVAAEVLLNFRRPVSTLSLFAALKRKHRKKKKQQQRSPRTRPVQREPVLVSPHLESIVQRDAAFRFLTRTKDFLSSLPGHVVPLSTAGKLYRELGFPRGRSVTRSALRHPFLLSLPRHPTPSLGFTDLMEQLLLEERSIMAATESDRVTAIRKFLMITKDKRVPLAKLHHCRHLFGISDEFRDRVLDYPQYFRVTVEDKRHILELAAWEPALAVSKLERDFVSDEDRVRRAFKFPVPHKKSMALDEGEERRMDEATTLPLVSPYTDGSGLNLWTVEAEKYRVGVIHELLSLTVEKRASIHHIVEFKEELCLTKHTYAMLRKQHRAFYLAGTEMNWAVFLREAYREEDGSLVESDPLVEFNEKLRRYACMSEDEFRRENVSLVAHGGMS